MKCRIVSALAPLPLTAQNAGVGNSFDRAVGDAGPYGDVRNFRRVVLAIGPMWASAPTVKTEVFLTFWRGMRAPPYRILSRERCRAGPMCPAALDRRTSSGLRRGRCPHRPADRPACSFNLRRGRRPRRPAGRRTNSYISEHERQRRSRDDSKLRPRPTEPLLADRKGSQETLVSCASLGTFCAYRKYPAGGRTRRFKHQFPVRGNRHMHRRKIRNPAS